MGALLGLVRAGSEERMARACDVLMMWRTRLNAIAAWPGSELKPATVLVLHLTVFWSSAPASFLPSRSAGCTQNVRARSTSPLQQEHTRIISSLALGPH